MLNFMTIFIKFIIYSFVGYVSECIFVSVENKKLTNRGFFCGPICPIYGIGGIFMAFFLQKYYGDVFAIFILGAILATIVEYITGWALEKLFHNKWWDYSKNKFNINGRVCLLNTILFGIAAVIVVMFADPFISNLLNSIPRIFRIIIGVILLIVFVFDMIYSWIVAFNLRNNIIIVEDLKNKKLNDLPELLEQHLKKHIKRFKRIPRRISKVFPKFITNYTLELDLINKIKNANKKINGKRKK